MTRSMCCGNSIHHSARRCVYRAESSPMLSVRKRERWFAAIQNWCRGSLPRCLTPMTPEFRCRLCRRWPPEGRHPSRTPKDHGGPRSGPDLSAEGGRPDSNRNLEDHDLGCLPLHHDHHAPMPALPASADHQSQLRAWRPSCRERSVRCEGVQIRPSGARPSRADDRH
jgi:hypothetical protein